MRRVKDSLRPTVWGNLWHLVLNVAVPVSVLSLVRKDLIVLAILVVVASKWQVVAVQPRHWLANFRANSVDFVANLSFLVFYAKAEHVPTLVLWLLLHIGWLLWLKPKSGEIYVGIQSGVAQFIGMTALMWLSDNLNEAVLVLLAWFIASTAARHFLASYEEPLIRVISFMWGLLVAQMAFIMNRWLNIYAISQDIIFPQLAVIISAISYVLGVLYYLEKSQKLRRVHVRSYILAGCVILIFVIVSSGWNISQ